MNDSDSSDSAFSAQLLEHLLPSPSCRRQEVADADGGTLAPMDAAGNRAMARRARFASGLEASSDPEGLARLRGCGSGADDARVASPRAVQRSHSRRSRGLRRTAALRACNARACRRAGERVEDAEAHGLQRWQQGYRLREVTREWTHLQRCLLDELHSYAVAHPGVDPAVLHAAYRGLVELCSEGISDSTGQYFHLRADRGPRPGARLEPDAGPVARARARACGSLARGGARPARELRRGRERDGGADAAGGAGADARRSSSGCCRSSVSSVHSMLEDVMTLARLQAGQEQRRLRPFDAAPLLREIVRGVPGGGARSGVVPRRPRVPNGWMSIGDPVKIRRIVQNLMLNALKYTQSGGVTVSWGDSRAGDAERWMLTVRDTGPGIHAGPGAPIAEALEDATQEASQTGTTGKPSPGASIAPPARPAGEARYAPRAPGARRRDRAVDREAPVRSARCERRGRIDGRRRHGLPHRVPAELPAKPRRRHPAERRRRADLAVPFVFSAGRARRAAADRSTARSTAREPRARARGAETSEARIRAVARPSNATRGRAEVAKARPYDAAHVVHGHRELQPVEFRLRDQQLLAALRDRRAGH